MPVFVLEEEMPMDELIEWVEYLTIKQEAEKKATDKARREAKQRR